MGVDVREEIVDDLDGIRVVNRVAFGGEEEAVLVDRLRNDSDVVVSLVAVADDAVIGHALFSRLPIECDGEVVVGAALAPVAVDPVWQRQGIGSALIRQGLDFCAERGIEAVVVLGHPEYYPRFGFSAELARDLVAPFAGPAFMVLELEPGVLVGGGTVRYAKAFSSLSD